MNTQTQRTEDDEPIRYHVIADRKHNTATIFDTLEERTVQMYVTTPNSDAILTAKRNAHLLNSGEGWWILQ